MYDRQEQGIFYSPSILKSEKSKRPLPYPCKEFYNEIDSKKDVDKNQDYDSNNSTFSKAFEANKKYKNVQQPV